MLAFLLGVCLVANCDDRPDIVIADFEGPDYGDWVVTGEAFGKGPARGTLPDQMPVDGFLGKGFVNTYLRGDGTTGMLTSPRFVIERKRINFLIGGGRQPNTAFVQLLVDGKAVVTATGRNSEYLTWDSWDVSGFTGKTAHIEIIDQATGAWGHINVDQIVQSDRAPDVADERKALLARANEAVRAASARAQADPDRPTFHVLAPAQWMNDPNGPIYYKDQYHLFYQHNPYGDGWGNMHWGHVRSRDLVRWEHRPIALWPSKSRGEDHVFSGCATIGPDDRPMIFYTSIGPRLPEQWAATPDDDSLDLWTKHPASPVLAESLHGATKVNEWRDPFVFQSQGKTYMVLGGNLNGSQGGQGVVNVYRAEGPELTKWTYLGVLFQHPDAAVKNVECPLFFPLDGQWVLIVSQGKPVDWFVGDLDESAMRFTPRARGKVDFGQIYAPNVLMNDPEGRRVLWGWFDGVPENKGWRHALTLPRLLSIGPEGTLRQRPLPDLKSLRRDQWTAEAGPIEGTRTVVEKLPAAALELALECDRGEARRVGLRVGGGIEIVWDGEALALNGAKSTLSLTTGRALSLRVFVDHAMVEVYANDEVCLSRFIKPGADQASIEVFARGGTGSLRAFDAWSIASVWDEPK
jgi:sucrose-6-phosphate hydrolase SacC (GH32 family)